MTEHSFARVVVDRSEISVTSNRASVEPSNGAFDVFIDGTHRGTIQLGRDYPPSIGVYGVGEISVWAGNRAAVITPAAPDWIPVVLSEPIHAIYRLRRGWCVVAELSVVTVDGAGAVVARSNHREIIVSSRWVDYVLVLEDFEGNALTVKVDADSLRLGEIENRSRSLPARG
jgi:hypothetical protein